MISSSNPTLRDYPEALLLSGFSGATIALVQKGNRTFVRKAANSPEGNEGLRDQALRQQALSELVRGCATMPTVFNMGYIEGHFYFDMEFVPSRDAINFLSNSPFHSISDFAGKIERLMMRLSETASPSSAPLPPSIGVINQKLDQITAKTEGRFASQIGPLEEAIALMGGLAELPATTAVHGDLTFENILVDRRGELWLIDTIASPFDHYWIDWSKLFQECEGLWHTHRGRPLARGVTWWLRQRFLEVATNLDPSWPVRHYIMLGLTFARILPYAITDHDRAFVSSRTEECGRAALELLS